MTDVPRRRVTRRDSLQARVEELEAILTGVLPVMELLQVAYETRSDESLDALWAELDKHEDG